MKQCVFCCTFVVILVSFSVIANCSEVKRTRVVSHDDYYYQIISQDLVKLKEEGIPIEVIAKLEQLKDRKYEKFEGPEALELEKLKIEHDLTNTIGTEQTAQYKSLILKYAKKPVKLEESFELTWDGWKVAITLCAITIILVGYKIFKHIIEREVNEPKMYQLLRRTSLQESAQFFNLRQQIAAFLRGIPNIHDHLSQQAFLNNVGFDEALHNQLHVGEPPAQFVELLVSNCMKYGSLQDGRHSLKATLEAAKTFVGKDKQAYCETLIQELEDSIKKE